MVSEQKNPLLYLLMNDDRFKEFSIEDYITAIRDYIENDLTRYIEGIGEGETPHPGVVAALEGCINHLQDASLAYYASLK